MRISATKRIALTALCCLICWGCGPAGRGKLPDLIPVKGRVAYKGKPLTKGMITFVPDGYGREARGDIQSDGSFVLTTFKPGDGVVAGEHRVTITHLEKSIDNDRALTKYASPNTTPLIRKVDAEHGEFAIDIP
jgi:hypothetical protein